VRGSPLAGALSATLLLMTFSEALTYQGHAELAAMLETTKSIRLQLAEVHSRQDQADVRDELGSLVGKLRSLEEKLKDFDADLALIRRLPG
jgi:hypothetical protein